MKEKSIDLKYWEKKRFRFPKSTTDSSSATAVVGRLRTARKINARVLRVHFTLTTPKHPLVRDSGHSSVPFHWRAVSNLNSPAAAHYNFSHDEWITLKFCDFRKLFQKYFSLPHHLYFFKVFFAPSETPKTKKSDSRFKGESITLALFERFPFGMGLIERSSS